MVTLKSKILAFLVWLFYRLLWLTWRIQYVEPESLKNSKTLGLPFIISHWHGDEMALVHTGRRYRAITIISLSKDGEIMKDFFALNGGASVRGSSSKGGAEALRQLVKVTRNKKLNASFAVDGPKGPIYKVKPGIFQFQRLHPDHPIIYCAGIAVDRFWRFEKSWNKTILPKPFAKVVIHWLDSGLVVDKNFDPRDPTLALNLEDAMRNSQILAQKILNPN